MGLSLWLARTMVIERLFGVGTYFVLLVFMYVAVKNSRSKTALRLVLNIYVLLLCIMGFFYIPSKDADLTRWREYMEVWRKYSLREFYQQYLSRYSTPAAYLLMFLCAKTGVDGLLPLVCTWIFYGNVFYILKDLHMRHDYSPKSIATALFVFMALGSFADIITGIRCFTGLAILGRCFYDEIYNGKPILKNIVWEIIAALMHSMALILLCLRIIYLLLQKNNSLWRKLFNIGLVAAFIFLIIQYGLRFLRLATNKAWGYLTNDEAYSYGWEYLIGGIAGVIFLIVLLVQHGQPLERNERELRISNTSLLIMTLVLSFEYSIFHRMMGFLSIMMLPVIVGELDRRTVKRNFRQTLMLLSAVVLVIACARGNLSGYKFFLLT